MKMSLSNKKENNQIVHGSFHVNTPIPNSDAKNLKTVLNLILEIYIFWNENLFIYKGTWNFFKSSKIIILIDNIYSDSV